MSEAQTTEQAPIIPADAPIINTDLHELTDEFRQEIRAGNVHENFTKADEARGQLRTLLAKAKYENGIYDFSEVEEGTPTEHYDKAQKLQAVISEINHVNNQKLLSTDLMRTARANLVGTPAMQVFDAAQNGGQRDVFARFSAIHGLDLDKIFENYKYTAQRATVDDFLQANPEGGYDGGLSNPNPTRTGSGPDAAGVYPLAPGYSPSGVPVDRYLSPIPAQMHLRKRDYLTPLLQRIPCPPITDTLRYISEELASGAPGASNKVTGVPEGGRAAAQDMNTREIVITVIKRMISATITNEQLTDTLQARQIMHDNLLIKMQEDFEDQVINGDDGANNMRGIFYRPATAPSQTDLIRLDAAHPWFKQVSQRGADEKRTLLDFYLDSATDYLRPRPDGSVTPSVNDDLSAYGAGRSPTHIVLSLREKMRLMGVKDNQGRYMWANTVEGDFISLWGLPIIISDYIPAEKGLIAALDDIAIVVKAGVEWNFGLKNDDLTRDQTTMVAKHRANVLVKRPRSIMILENLSGK